MTDTEFKLVLAIACEADSGCSVCVSDQFRHLAKAFPEYKEMIIGTARELGLHQYKNLIAELSHESQ